MRIAFFIDDYLPSVHGVATSTLNYKQALESLGHEVFVVAPKCEGYEDHDDHVIRLPSAKNYVFDKREMAVIYPGLARKLDEYQFDIGNYDDYLRQNASATGNAMQDYEQTERRIANLRDKVLQFRRLKEKARDPGTIAQFKRRENQAAAELEKLEKIDKPTFWIDRENVAQLDYKVADRYQKFKARNIRLNMRDGAMRSQRKLVEARDLALGFDKRILFEGVNINLREGEAIELRGRNGAGKTTLIRALMADTSSSAASSGRLRKTAQVTPQLDRALTEDTTQSAPIVYAGSLYLDPHIRVGIYEQEIAATYLNLPLARAIEQMHLDRGLKINDTKIRQLMGDYLFVESDGAVPLASLSGGQKARFQLISMLANEPQLLILDEPTNHLDLPSIEELEAALERYAGAILYVSHDDYFRRKIGGSVVQIGS
jgi:ATP-binding cassette, subfamily F, member 3